MYKNNLLKKYDKHKSIRDTSIVARSMYKYHFSIIIAVYNTEEYLEECLQSVIMQDIGFRKNVELILVDDGSTDGSLSICNKYRDLYPKNIRVIHQRNLGVSVARNRGIEIAEGEYLNFLDSDDKLSLNALSVASKFLGKNEDVDLVSIPIHTFDRESRVSTGTSNKFENGSRVIDLLTEMNIVQTSMSSTFTRSSAFASIRFDPRLRYSEDAKVCIQILSEKKKIGVVNEAIYFYRKRSTNDNKSATDKLNSIYSYGTTLKYFTYDIIHWCKEREGGILPKFVQCTLLFDLLSRYRYASSVGRENPEYEASREYLRKISEVLRYIDEDVIFGFRWINKEEKKDFLEKKHKNPDKSIDIKMSVLWNLKKVFWGKCGKHSKKLIQLFCGGMQYGDIFVDENVAEQGRLMAGLPICKPESLENITEKFIVIVLSDDYEEARMWLSSHGFVENVDFVDGKSLYQRQSVIV